MKKTILLAVFLYSTSLISQINYTSSNYASGNYSLQMSTVTTGLFLLDFDTTGANITWDYSTLGKNINGFKRTVSPGSSGYQTPFITQCILGGGGFGCLSKWNNLTDLGSVDLDSMNLFVVTLYDVTTMMSKSNNKLVGTIKGLKIKDTNGLTVPIVAEYSHKDTILQFPLTYLSSKQSYGAWGIDLNSLGQNIAFKSTYQRNYTVEGWGKLITPFKTYNNTVKIKTKLKQVDSINYFGTKFGIPRKIIEYTWYDVAYKLPIMKAEGIEVAGVAVINSVSYHDTASIVSGIEEIKNVSKSINIYPNPAKETLTVSFNKDIKITNYIIIDAIGREYSNNLFSKNISLSTIENGNYFIQFFNNNQLVGVKKFIVVR